MSVYRKISLDDCLDELSSLHSLASQVVPSEDEIVCYKDGKELTLTTITVRTKDLFALKKKLDSLYFDE